MSKTILHLDDEVEIRELLSAFLTSKGYRVFPAATATEAIALARREKLDLVITDLQLDEADGLDTIEKLKGIQSQVPIIILTGVLITPSVAQETLGQKVACYLEKTTPLAQIHVEIKRLIGA